MSQRVLITGGAGFIGSHLADELLRFGYTVRVLDCLLPQVHGPAPGRPKYLSPQVELVVGDVGDRHAVRNALHDVDAVVHLAAMVGVGQSMYEIEKYTATNNRGTAVLLEAIIKTGTIGKLVVASSMSIYGEGLYRDTSGVVHQGGQRTVEQLRKGEWELTDRDGRDLTPLPTTEEKIPSLASVYALSKYDQERMAIIVGDAYRIPVTALRFFNVYGPRQALSNPYTGVLAIFASRLLNNNPPRIFEDGLQRRDFVSVYDVAAACRLALEVSGDRGEVFNIGTGQSYNLRYVLSKLTRLLECEHLQPEITGSYRAGDIRHCFADITAARTVLGYEPKIRFDDGLAELATWLKGETAVDHVSQAHAELAARGLTL